jgi:segregation and condensation protein A
MSTREPPHPIDPNFRIELPTFEGPLDLLVFLIQKHELDILDLPIAFVTERYLEYIGMMKQLNLDVASEYLVMAAELARIKSKMLLPQEEHDEDEREPEEETDPRAELIQRLLHFQKYKRAGDELGSRGIAGRDVFPRGIPAPQAEGQAPLAEVSVFKLLDALKRIIDRTKSDLAFEVSAERISIQERMNQITDWLRDHRECRFEELFEGATTTYDIVVTFLALLEMAKGRMLRIFQPTPKEPIYLEYRVLDVDEGEEGDEGLTDVVTAEAAVETGTPDVEVGPQGIEAGADVAVGPDVELGAGSEPGPDVEPGPDAEPPAAPLDLDGENVQDGPAPPGSDDAEEHEPR